VLRAPEARILLVTLVLFAVLAAVRPREFLTADNGKVLLLSLFAYAIMACGETLLLVSGGFDLSVGSVEGLAGMVAALSMARAHLPWPIAAALGLAAGLAAGLANGLLVARARINPFITTLATMILARGAVHVISGGSDVTGFPIGFRALGQARIAGIQAPVVIALVLVVVADVLLRRHRWFRQSYYIGGNEEAARLSGIPVARVKTVNYAISGLLAGLAGVLVAARFNTAVVDAGETDELRVITAVIIGGASLSGGVGTILGSFLGCVLMATIATATILLSIGPHWEKILVGGILLGAVVFDRIGRRR
jgi:ribose transport system permease protein